MWYAAGASSRCIYNFDVYFRRNLQTLRDLELIAEKFGAQISYGIDHET